MIIPKRKIRYPIAIEREYAKLLVAYVKAEYEIIESFIPEMTDALIRNAIKQDDTDDYEESLTEKMLKVAGLLVVFDKMRKKLQKISPTKIIDKIFGRVNKHVEREHSETIKSVFGSEPRVEKNNRQFEMLKTIWTAENMTLIKSIDSQTMDKIRFTLSQKIIATANKEMLMSDLTKDIRQLAGVSETRAALIGADQVGKLNGRLTQYRQMSAGIESYIWRTMGDRRVRPNHAARSGQVFKWSNPPDGGHPGQAVRCRCVAQPLIDEQSFKLVPQKNSYTNYAESGKMSTTDKLVWPPFDKSKILSKEEYVQLRELADEHGIYLSGVKKFDGDLNTIKSAINTLADLQNKFPGVSNEKKRLTLSLSTSMHPNDFAVTNGKIINLNANAYRDINLLQKEYNKLVEDGWFVKGTDYRAIIHHEFGHVVSDAYKIDSMKIACDITGKNRIEILTYLQENLSEYSIKLTDGSEIIAEVFADVSTGKPSYFSQKFYTEVLAITRRS